MNTNKHNAIYNDDYEKPAIEIIEMEIESAILTGSGTGTTPTFPGTGW